VLGRGFEVAEVAGDRGAGAKLQLLRDLPHESRILGKASFYGFYDFGAVWSQDSNLRESAATAGAGVGLNGGPVTGYLEVAKPLTHPDVDGRKGARLFFELASRF
jgi:hemolysin activation/secretion protein